MKVFRFKNEHAYFVPLDNDCGTVSGIELYKHNDVWKVGMYERYDHSLFSPSSDYFVEVPGCDVNMADIICNGVVSALKDAGSEVL